MPGIYMTCPTTGREVFTSQHVSAPGLEAALQAGGRFRCPVCNQVHAWTEADAIIGGSRSHLRSDASLASRRR